MLTYKELQRYLRFKKIFFTARGGGDRQKKTHDCKMNTFNSKLRI